MKRVFRAEDGADFDTEEECKAYEDHEAKREPVSAYVDKMEVTGRSRSRIINTIMRWEKHREGYL